MISHDEKHINKSSEKIRRKILFTNILSETNPRNLCLLCDE